MRETSSDEKLAGEEVVLVSRLVRDLQLHGLTSSFVTGQNRPCLHAPRQERSAVGLIEGNDFVSPSYRVFPESEKIRLFFHVLVSRSYAVAHHRIAIICSCTSRQASSMLRADALPRRCSPADVSRC